MFTFVFLSKCNMLTTCDANKAIWQISIHMIFLRIRRLGKFLGRQEIMALKFESLRSLDCLWKVWDDIQNSWDKFYLHVVLLNQHLLELSPPTSQPKNAVQRGKQNSLENRVQSKCTLKYNVYLTMSHQYLWRCLFYRVRIVQSLEGLVLTCDSLFAIDSESELFSCKQQGDAKYKLNKLWEHN